MKHGLLILISVLLTACTTLSPRGSEELQQGKTSYEAGEFKKALHELLPPAVAGNPKAQYAIGYMYYYGYGTAQDTEAGVFWMKKAADRNYRPAIKAMELINQQNKSPDTIKIEQKAEKSRDVTPVLQRERERYDEIMRSDSSVPSSEKVIDKPVSLQSEQKKNDEVLRSIKFNAPERLTQANVSTKEISADGYGLQLLGAYDLETVKKMQSTLGVKDSAVIWHAEHNKKDWYVLMYGHYKTVADAKFAIASLPPQLQSQGPWVRSLKNLG